MLSDELIKRLEGIEDKKVPFGELVMESRMQ